MPKFFCNQCGAPMETGDSFAPPDPTCPACRGEIVPAAGEDPMTPTAAAHETHPAAMPPPLAASPYHAPSEIPAQDSGRRRASGSMLFLRALLATLIGGSIAFAGFRSTMWGQVENNLAQLAGLWVGAVLCMAAAGLAVGLVAALVLLAFKKSFGRSFAHSYSLSVLLIALLACAGSLLAEAGYRKQRAREAQAKAQAQRAAKQEEEALQEMRDDKARMLAEMQNADGTPKKSNFRFESEVPKDANSSYRHLNQSLLNDAATVRNEYMEAVEKSGVHQLLDGTRLSADTDLKESRAIIAHCKELVEEHKRKTREILDSIPQRLDRYPLTAADKKDFLAGHLKELPNKIASAEAPWNDEAETIRVMGEIVEYLAANKTRWAMTDGKLLFDSNEGLAGFEAIMKRLDECVAKQLKQQQKLLEDAKLKGDEGK